MRRAQVFALLVVLLLAFASSAALRPPDALASAETDSLMAEAKSAKNHALHHVWCLGWLGKTPRVAAELSEDPAKLKEQTDWLLWYVGRTHRLIRHPYKVTSAWSWKPLALHVGWPPAAIPTLMKIIRRESGGNPAARNGVFKGLLQIWQAHAPKANLLNPEVNLTVGLQLWKRCSWRPWSL